MPVCWSLLKNEVMIINVFGISAFHAGVYCACCVEYMQLWKSV